MEIPIYYTTAIQYGTFFSIATILIGYADKKKNLMNWGWGIMILVGIFGIFLISPLSDLHPGNAPEGQHSMEFKVWFLGLQSIVLGLAALFSMLTISKKKIGKILAVLTVLFAISLFFQSYNLARYKKPTQESPAEQTKPEQ